MGTERTESGSVKLAKRYSERCSLRQLVDGSSVEGACISGFFYRSIRGVSYESSDTTVSREAYKLRQEFRENGASTQTLKSMTDLIVEIAQANFGRTNTTDKVNFEYNRHCHNQLRQLIELFQPFQDASRTTPAELQGLVIHRINAQIADGSDFGSDDSTDSKLCHVLHTKFDQFVGEIQ